MHTHTGTFVFEMEGEEPIVLPFLPPAAPLPAMLSLDPNTFSVQWRGLPPLPLGDKEFGLIEILFEERGRLVSHPDIEERCYGGKRTKPQTIRKLKHHLVDDLKKAGMHDLAAKIKSATRAYRLEL